MCTIIMLFILLLFQFVLQKAGVHKQEGICQNKLITYLKKCNKTLQAYMPVCAEVLTLVQHRCDDIGVM